MRDESVAHRQPKSPLFVWNDLWSTLGCGKLGSAIRAVGVHAQPHLRSNQWGMLVLCLAQIRKVCDSIRGLHHAFTYTSWLGGWSLRVDQYWNDI